MVSVHQNGLTRGKVGDYFSQSMCQTVFNHCACSVLDVGREPNHVKKCTHTPLEFPIPVQNTRMKNDTLHLI